MDDHPKVLSLLDEEGGAAALGLWTLCLAWAHRNTRRRGKVPGLLPGSLPRRYLGPDGKALAVLLVRVGLWDESEDGGWFIHDFDKYLPGDETRAARSEAGKRGAANRWAAKREAEAAGADSKLPSTDDKQPSDSHGVDSNAVASDGSRTRARRATPYGVAPTPTPIPEITPPSAGTAEPRRDGEVTARTIVGEWIERCRERPPSNVIGQISKQVKLLLDDGIHPDHVRRGLAEWMTRSVHPSVLPSLVNSVMNTVPAARDTPRQSRSTTDERVAQAQALKEQFRTSPPQMIRGEIA
ncbi:hypothetical protein [Nonomuraea sp. WAC 01424]|uniref:hypothetical protein n=1 Tax=Nonomuraea sp. WAC 01424 TaxID=2203200 RepID=UPI000F7764E5|nr:hypothetical protein [Nonomuraea sp. WAC 01424]